MLERLNQAIDHLERQLDEHPDQPVDVAALARTAATSEYHLRRLFSALAGMPLSEYVRRRRLTAAGAEVLAGRRTLLDIAVRHGYGSAEAFARAFRAVHGVGPGEARRHGAALNAQPRMSFRLVVEGSSSMRYRVVEKAEFRVVGRKARVPLVHEGMNPAIVEFVRSTGPDTRQVMEELSDQAPHGLLHISVGLDASRAEGTELDFYYGVVTREDAPGGLDVLPVPAGTWAVFESEGPFPAAVQHLWRDVFTQWFPSNPYRSRPGPEMLRARVSPDGARADAELWIPVEAAADQ
ncbi:AraC family transcriptional regulator [Streptomyces sp. TRM64462]|uniref:AraC family transcriptional regulator n=1 Tax=Streptomyces sp. TRM64462 TaxID=2741726 RepID=UPI001586C06B|nr:AraC family transcriptional regulator [Streptomyces sp. TRM64462]